MSHTLQMNEGSARRRAVQSLVLAGRDLTDHTMKIPIESGYSSTPVAGCELASDAEEDHLNTVIDVVLGYDCPTTAVLKSSDKENSPETPGGISCNIGSASLGHPGALCVSSMAGSVASGATFQSFMKCDADWRYDL